MRRFPLAKFSFRLNGLIYLLLFVVVIIYCSYLYYHIVLPDRELKKNFKPTACLVVAKKLAKKGILFHHYRADFLVSYLINGVNYKKWVSGHGLDQSYWQNQTQEEDLLSQYEVGTIYTCHYNPMDPEVVLLIMPHNWVALIYALIPLALFLVLVIALYKIFKLRQQLTENMTTLKNRRTRDKKSHPN